MSTTAIELKTYPSPISEENAELQSNRAELKELFAKRAAKPRPLRFLDGFTGHVSRLKEFYITMTVFPVAVGILFLAAGGDMASTIIAVSALPAVVAGSVTYDHRSKRRIKPILREVETTAGKIGRDVDSWLKERYGFSFGSKDDQRWIGKLLVGYQGPEASLVTFAPGKIGARDLLLESGATVKANFYLTESGGLEIRKAHVKDSTESPYFTPIREGLS